MMIGWATPTVEPLAGTNLGGPNGAVPVNGVGSCPAAGPATTPGSPGAGSGSASAGPALSTTTPPQPPNHTDRPPCRLGEGGGAPPPPPPPKNILPSSHFLETVSHSAQ